MKNIIFNLKELFGYSNLAVNPDGQPTVKRRSKITYICCLFAFLTLGVGQAWGANQRYIYVGISSNYQTYKDNSNYGFNFWGGTSGGVKSGTYIAEYTWDSRKYYMYRVQVYDDNNKAQFKGNNSWYDPGDGFSVTLNGTTNNAVFFSHSSDGWGGQFQQNYQVTSTASLSATSTSITTVGSSTLTPSLSSNATYNEIKSTSYSVTTNPGSGGSVTSAGVFTATKAGTYTVTATITYNAKDFSGITKTATATKTITVTAAAETTYGVTFNAGANGSISAKGTAISAGSNATIQIGATARPLTATPSDGYRFAGWTKTGSVTIADPSSDNTTVSATGTGTVTATWAAKTPVRLYFSNPDGWATVNAYVWKDATTVTDKNYDWPGVAITTNTVVNNCNTFYYYEYYKEDHPDWNRVIFNDGASNQTADLTFNNTTNNGQYSHGVASDWTSTPGSRWALAHSIDGYSTSSHLLTCGESTTSGYVDVVLEGNTDYQFKFVDTYTNTWYGVTSPTKITYTNKATARAMTNENGSNDNQTMTSAGAGTYRFTWDITNKKVKITYPTSYTVEFEVGTVKGNVNNPIIYHTSVDNANKVTSGNYVAAGTKVIFWIANSAGAAPKAGYNWWGFYNNAAGTGSNLPEKYTDNTVSVHTINSIAADAHVYAVFGEKDYWIAPYIVGEGSISPNGANGHVATKVSFTATPGTGYKFDNWTQRSGALTIESPNNATTNVNATAASELQANFSPKYAVRVKTGGGAWSDASANHLTGYGAGQIGYVDITLNANTDYEIQVYDRETNTWYGGSATQNIYYANSNTEFTIATTSSPQSVFIKTGAAGTYRFAWNLTGYKIAVEYPTSRFIEIGKSIAEAGSLTAVDGEGNTIQHGQAIRDGGSITFTITTVNTGYEFSGWYSNEACTTPYTHNGSTIVINDAEKTLQLTNVTADLTKVYAKFTPKTYTVTLTQTGAASAGTASVTASYNADAPTIATLPTAANGYAFMGYYSATDGEGTQFVQANGTWNDVTSYISGGKWIYDDDVTLYAYFKKAEITAITLNSSVLDPVDAGGTGWVIANPTVEPTPVLPVKICWELLYDNDNPVPAGHEAQEYDEAGKPNQVRFSIAGLAASRYKIKATLRTGSSCDGGTELSTFTQTFTIASSFTVTILYQDDDNNNIAPGTTSPGKATDWTTISAPDIFGYTFAGWNLGEGITTEDPTDKQNDFRFKASYYGTIVAQYTKNQYIYLDLSQAFSTYGKWDNPYVYFYNGDPWNNTNGAGATGHSHYISGHAMTKIDGTDIWYFDYGGVSGATRYVAFTWGNQTSQANFWKTDVIFRGDFSESTPLFVPATDGTAESRQTVVNEAQYYNKGYWVTYLGEATGYTLLVYNSAGDVELKREPFIAADKRMTMTSTVQLDASSNYKLEVLRNDGYYYNKAASNFTASSLGPRAIETGGSKYNIQTNADGIYTFTLGYNSGNLQLSVVYPSSIGDFRIAYTDNATWSHSHTLDSWILPSKTIVHRANGVDTISFFISKGDGITPKIRWQKVTGVNPSSVTWGTTVGTNCGAWLTTGYTDVSEAGVYNFKVTQNADGTSIASIERIGKYDGSYYIRCNALRSKWDHYTIDSDHRMTYSEFSESAANSFGEKYSHYKAKWCPRNTNIAFVIANDYSPCLTDKLTQDVGGPAFNNLEADGTLKYEKEGGNMKYNDASAYLDKYSANVRFMWNRKTNKISRAYVSAATSNNAKFLVLQGSGTANSNIYNGSTGSAFAVDPPGANSVILKDDQNWIYEEVIKANPSALVKLYANYCGQTQWFRGADGTPFRKDVNAIELLGGSASSAKYAVRVIYDFKTNRLVCAWMPEGASQEISTDLTVNADVMVIREHQGSAQCITFANDKSMTGVKTVYGAMKFNRWILSNRAHPEDTNPDHCRESNLGGDLADFHPVLPIGQQLSIYERSLYFISFPFDVKASEIFGFGHYWDEWYLEYYDGLNRAKNGYWKDSPANWKYVTPDMLEDFTLKANEGYILGLDLDFMQVDNTAFWSNGISTVELYFPSTVNLGTLQQTDVTIPALSSDYKCTINRGTPEGDRRVKDSYWRCLGVPSFNIYNSALKDSEGKPITWKTDYTWHADESEFPFIYMWNKADNTLTAQATSAFNFLPMHAYLVQNGGEIKWTAVSAKPSSIVARRESSAPTRYNWRITLSRDTIMEDQTYVRMTNLEQVTDTFDFGQDLVKELNTGRSDIYTYIGYERVAANSRPIANTQTVIPMGLNIESAGDYTFAIPEGTDGIGVTLIDEETGVRTSLGALSYTVNLPKGNYDNRFVLEISPIQTITTGIDEAPSNQGPSTKVRKVMIDGILYIVKDGKMYDARGTRVE